MAAGRLAIAGAIVFSVMLARRGLRVHDPATELRLVLAGLALATHFACWIASLRYTSVAVSTLLVTTTPVFTEIAEVARTRRMRPLAAASILLALAGVAIVTLPHGATAATGLEEARPLLGAGLALIGAVAIGAYLLLVRASDARYGTLAVVGRTYAVAAVVLIAAAAVAGEGPPAPSNGAAWAGIVAMALVSQLYGHTAFNAAVRTFSATFVSMTTLAEPIVAALLAAWLFHEALGRTTLAGAALVFLGIAVALRDEARRPGAAEGGRGGGEGALGATRRGRK